MSAHILYEKIHLRYKLGMDNLVTQEEYKSIDGLIKTEKETANDDEK
jgi:hypothetical protein